MNCTMLFGYANEKSAKRRSQSKAAGKLVDWN